MDDKTTERAEPPAQHGPSSWVIGSTVNAPLSDLVPCERDRTRDEFSDFYREFFTHLTSWLILHGWMSAADAYDVAQDTMRLAYERWPTIEHPKAWARRTASRLCVERLARGEMLPVEDIEDRIPRKGDTCAIAMSDTLQDFLAALQQLPPRQRQLLLWAYEEYEPTEIAAELKMTPEAVRSSLWKARRNLAKIMHGQDSDQ
ncbi:sigma-70 family RNA polymerase sigma factor [Micromonospora sp. NBC_00362]|uniref:RNA polymerase sigma factor n=1 Tax=Micromonospora sp. NBC_00362 TaxID=2975975 RepID=UPI00225748CD|nr:sigma-70 family RNA polymerase sigma factor [Micromonospora sp. NBC_00362]MCX5122020.1 sigma-70 family RNA polymerase sigma factor [Micromonospora sp. NBC_00362]